LKSLSAGLIKINLPFLIFYSIIIFFILLPNISLFPLSWKSLFEDPTSIIIYFALVIYIPIVFEGIISLLHFRKLRYSVAFTIEENSFYVSRRIFEKFNEEDIRISNNSGFVRKIFSPRLKKIEYVFGSPSLKTQIGLFSGICIYGFGGISVVSVFANDKKYIKKTKDIFEPQEHWRYPFFKQVFYLCSGVRKNIGAIEVIVIILIITLWSIADVSEKFFILKSITILILASLLFIISLCILMIISNKEVLNES